MPRRTFAFLCLAAFGFAQAPNIGGACTVFPADNIWNTPVDQLPVAANSSTYVSTIGATKGVHADFGAGIWDGGPIGIPFTTVLGSQTKYPATFLYWDESDQGPYAVPLTVPIEGGSASDGDRHALAIDTNNCILYELYRAFPKTSSWQADSGAIYNLLLNNLRPSTWTSADAAGLPIFPGLFRYDEIVAGEIRHALRFTVPQTRRAYVWPARHYASSLTGAQYPPMGARFRLRAGFDISTFSPTNQIILRALKKYGMMIADNGSAWYLSGAPDSRWNDDDLHKLGSIRGSDFEVVDVSGLMISANSGQARQSTPASVTVSVTPASASVQVGKTQAFSANQAVTWTASAGTISSTGLYTAPAGVPSPSTVTIQARSLADTSAVGTAAVTVTPPPAAVTVTIAPAGVSVQAAATRQFIATVNNSSNQAVTWTASAGIISSTGLYTAPASVPSPATVTIQARSLADTSVVGVAVVTVTPPASAVTVAISPTSASVRILRSRTFSATVLNTSNTAVTWQVNGIPGGSFTHGYINSQGTYFAPWTLPPGGVVTVNAVSVADPTKSAGAMVTIVRR